MEKLTKAEEEIMQQLWLLERGTVSNIIEAMNISPKPPHSSISSIVRILEKKGYVTYKAFGKTHEYYPLISKDDYAKRSLQRVVSDYFGGSANNLVSFLVKENDLSVQDLSELLDRLK